MFKMTWNERRVLKKIAKRIVCQSPQHANNITMYYQILVEAARNEFREDNDTTLDVFLIEQHRNASQQALKHSFYNNKKLNFSESS